MLADSLRKSILQAAIEGKLTQREPDDGDARDLLVEIQEEKARLVREGKIRRSAPLPLIADDEIPFDIPENWCWVRLGEITTLAMGKTPSRSDLSYWDGNIPWVSISDMRQGEAITNTKECVTSLAVTRIFRDKIVKAGTLLMSFKLTIGRCCILGVDAVHNEAIVSIYPFVSPQIFNNYLMQSLPLLTGFGDVKGAMKGSTLNSSSLNNLLFPLPPLAEQRRVVARLEELLPLIDTLVDDEKELETIEHEFPNAIRKSLLQAAIEGKLTQRESGDGDARDLLAEIQAEKARLISSGKIRRSAPLPPIADEEIPFDIPDNWLWVRLGEVVNIVSARRVHQSDWQSEGIPFYRAREIAKLAEEGHVNNELFISEALFKKFALSGLPKANDLMVTAVGTLGKTYIVKDDDRFYYKDASVICLENFAQQSASYLKFILSSNMMIKQIQSNSSGTTVATLTIVRMMNYIIPLPPLAEQRRIAARLEELLSLIDDLK